MRLFNKVAIIGTGLIGGSLGLVIKNKKLAREVVGVSRHQKSLILAKSRGAIDKGSLSLNVIKGADLVILATPVGVILKSAPRIAKLISKDCIVTDVGSTKKEIVSRLNKLIPRFIGSHPLAGSEKRSISHAQADLFKGSLCIITPGEKKALNKVRALWEICGAHILIMSADKHDKILSSVSHLPHLVAFSLIKAVPGENLKFASSGLKDTTRIASSDSELWADIILSNKKNILKSMKAFEKEFDQLKTAISAENKPRLARIFKQAREKRETLE